MAAGAVAVGSLTTTDSAQAQAEEAPVVAGVIERVEPPAVVLTRSEGAAAVTFTPEAEFWKDGPARLEDFVPGDHVTVEGGGPAEAFVGSYMITTYRTIEASVERRDGLRLLTTEGPVAIVPQTELLPEHKSKPIEQIGRGDRIIAICRTDATSPNLIALRMGVT